MLEIQSKLLDFKTKECVGVVCLNGCTSVALSLDKAKDLGIEDIEIIEFLDVPAEDVVINTKRHNCFCKLDSSIGFLDNYEDIPYEMMGSITNIIDCKEVISGYVFNYLSFVELDNSEAIKRALSDSER